MISSEKKFGFCSDKKITINMVNQEEKVFLEKPFYLPKYAKLSRLTLPIKRH